MQNKKCVKLKVKRIRKLGLDEYKIKIALSDVM